MEEGDGFEFISEATIEDMQFSYLKRMNSKLSEINGVLRFISVLLVLILTFLILIIYINYVK